MNRRIGFAALILGAAVVLSSANSASACFGFLGNRGCGCCEPACCDSGCGHRCCLLGLFHRHNDCCCEETCCAEEG